MNSPSSLCTDWHSADMASLRVGGRLVRQVAASQRCCYALSGNGAAIAWVPWGSMTIILHIAIHSHCVGCHC